MIKKVYHFFTTDYLFLISFILAFMSSVFGRFELQFIDFKVILSLFGLMLVVESFNRLGILEKIAQLLLRWAQTKRQLFFYFVSLSYVASMFLTNDVAILTLLPMFYLICEQRVTKKELVLGSVWIIVAANLGSSLFPSGNPQNIFLFSYYHLSLAQFFWWVMPFAALSIALLGIGLLCISKQPIAAATPKKYPRTKGLYVASIAFLVMLLYVVNILTQWWLVGLVCLLLYWRFPESYQKIDYRLLLTFACFFIIVGNIKALPQIAEFVAKSVQTPRATLVSAAFSSQIISNVPAAFLLAPFTKEAHSLIIGVNIGGMGTLLASLANLIGYRILSVYVPHIKASFLLWFTGLNVVYFTLFIGIFWLLS